VEHNKASENCFIAAIASGWTAPSTRIGKWRHAALVRTPRRARPFEERPHLMEKVIVVIISSSNVKPCWGRRCHPHGMWLGTTKPEQAANLDKQVGLNRPVHIFISSLLCQAS
jgi:hypothetical protein